MPSLKKYASFLFGLFLVAVAFQLFLSPYNLVAGGVSGLSIVVKQIFQIDESLFVFIMNIFLIFISFLFLGVEKTKNTILGSFLLPFFLKLTSNISNLFLFDLDLLLISVLGGVLSGFGYGLIFKYNFTTGGTDILNQIVEKYLHIPLGKSILFVDGFIVLLGCITFGIPTMVYSLISLFLISEISNRTQLGINKNRVLYITSSKFSEIKNYLTDSGYDVTIMNVKGGYSKKDGKILICSIYEKDYFRIKEGISVLDANAFFVVTNAYEQKNANVTIRKNRLKEKR